MLGIYASALLICAASLVAGRTLLRACGREDWSWLEGAAGFALLIVIAQPLVRLPGRGTTAAVILGVALVLALVHLVRRGELSLPVRPALGIALVALVVASLPFLLNGRSGVLGEGIYSNDQAVHLYWADWVQNGVGPQPEGIALGYPVGPHSLVAAVSTATAISVEDVFNGLLLAIPALTALTALAALEGLSPPRRWLVAALTGLPYLGAAFLTQSSFKETATALYLLAFALALRELDRGARSPPLLVAVAALVLAAMVTLSLPAVGWFALGGAIWLGASLATGRRELSLSRLRLRLRRSWPLVGGGSLVLAALLALQAGALSRFVDRVDEVQASAGRLASRVPPWEVLGAWPEGDFRLGAADVDGEPLLIALGLLAVVVGGWRWLRRGELAVPATLAAAFAVYLYTRVGTGIHVEAKALAVAAPLVMLVALRGLLEPEDRGFARGVLAVAFASAALVSTLLALRAGPVGTESHPGQLGELRGRVKGHTVLFLGLDRFAPYRLRGTEEVRSPGGYVPDPIQARPGKEWQQGEPLDFDSVEGDDLDRFRFVVTTAAPYASSPAHPFKRATRTEDFILWKRRGHAVRRQVLDEDGSPGVALDCGQAVGGSRGGRLRRLGLGRGIAGVLPSPVVSGTDGWRSRSSFEAPGSAHLEVRLPPGDYDLSLQYNSEVDLTVEAPGLSATLPAALDGMYAFAPGQGPFWPVGRTPSDGEPLTIEVRADELSWLEDLVGAERRVWLGTLAATRAQPRIPADRPAPAEARVVALQRACGRYVDWYKPTDE